QLPEGLQPAAGLLAQVLGLDDLDAVAHGPAEQAVAVADGQAQGDHAVGPGRARGGGPAAPGDLGRGPGARAARTRAIGAPSGSPAVGRTLPGSKPAGISKSGPRLVGRTLRMSEAIRDTRNERSASRAPSWPTTYQVPRRLTRAEGSRRRSAAPRARGRGRHTTRVPPAP